MADAPAKTEEKEPGPPDPRGQFVHLHNHSHYSLLDGLSKVDEMVKLAKSWGMPAVAITDHGNMYGAIEFYKECKKAGINPIIGVEAYIANRTRFDKEPGIDKERYHLTLLAYNTEGYKNLIQLVTKANLEGYYYKPRMDKGLLREYHEGIIALSGCFGSELSRTLQTQGYEEGKKIALEYQDIFGKGNYYIEVMRKPEIEGHTENENSLIKLSRELDIPLVGTQDSHYLHHDDRKAHDTLLRIQTGDMTGKQLTFECEAHFFDAVEAAETFKDIPDAVTNTLKIAERCNIELDLGKWVFPDITVEDGLSPDDELRKISIEGIEKRKLIPNAELTTRMDYELDVIKQKGYAKYFLVVADLLRFAAENGIYTNIRGSVAGSLVTYLTGITKVNPLEYKLPFERFLNPERPSAPDIDMDYADNRRDEMIEYARNKYGQDHVAQIGTFGTMLAKGAVRDVARALGHPYAVGDKISKMIPMGSQGFPMTIERAFELDPELQPLYDTDPAVKEIIDLAKKLEGCVRHISVHAAGVVIAPTPLTDFCPTQLDPKGGKIITQYDMHAVEDAGLLKFDFLGIRNLAILRDAVRIVKETQGIDVDIENIPRDDKHTFEMLARGETMGLFQLNGAGMTKYLKELRPTTIHDINAMVALYRPGPLESIPEYIKRKQNPKTITYLDPRLQDILSASYGVITYQDDVLLISIHLAGYSWLEADKLRKAMGKKIPAEMEAQKKKLHEGFVAHGLTEEKAKELWSLIEPFAAYGFNKAHAASYGLVAYQTAYMKANFPAEYMTAVLTAESGDVEEIAAIITECKRMEIPVLPPDVNESFRDFTVIKGATPKEDKIRFGLLTIKNLGGEIADAIIQERDARGKFTSFADLLDRVKHKNLNKKSLEALIKTGAMDAFGERGQLLFNMDEALEYNREGAKSASSNQDSLFALFEDQSAAAIPTLRLKESPPAEMADKLSWEKELLGLYVSGHPLQKFKEKFEKSEHTIKGIREFAENAPVVVAGLVEELKVINTKNGDQMAFMTVADFTGSVEVVVFPRTYAEAKHTLVPEACLAVKGKVSHRNGEFSILADAFKAL